MMDRRLAQGCRSGVAGFTLVELLVSLTLLGLISVLLFGGLRFGTRAWEAGDAHSQRLTEVQAVQALLRQRLSQAVRPSTPQLDAIPGEVAGSFVGDEQNIRFIGLGPSQIGAGGLYIFDLAIVDDADAQRLELGWQLYRPDYLERATTGESESADRRVLIEDFERAKFSYYGADKEEGTADWRDRWDGQAGLPVLVGIEMAFPEPDPRSWPKLVVAPKLRRLAR